VVNNRNLYIPPKILILPIGNNKLIAWDTQVIIMNITNYARNAAKAVYRNSEAVGATAFALIVPVGVAAETAITGNYDPDKWIALGSAPLTAGNVAKAFYIHGTENPDGGTKTKYISLIPRIAGPAYLGIKSTLGFPVDDPQVLTDIAAFGTSYATGFAGEIAGNARKKAASPRWRVASEINNALKNEKRPLSGEDTRKLQHELEGLSS